MRFFTKSAAQGCKGRPSLNPAPTFRNVAAGGPSAVVAAGAGGLAAGGPTGGAPAAPPTFPERNPGPSPAGGLGFCQMPERSGFPSAVLGAGALKFGSPVGVLGTPGTGNGGHCANSDGERTATSAITPMALCKIFISVSRSPRNVFKTCEACNDDVEIARLSAVRDRRYRNQRGLKPATTRLANNFERAL